MHNVFVQYLPVLEPYKSLSIIKWSNIECRNRVGTKNSSGKTAGLLPARKLQVTSAGSTGRSG